MIRIIIFSILLISGQQQTFANDETHLQGMGAVKWGTSREAIVEMEGLPDFIDDEKSSMWYLNKRAMGKQVEVVYNFGDKCTIMVDAECHFSDGYYIFNDASKAYADKLGRVLDGIYGEPVSVEHSSELGPDNYVSSGKKELQHTIYVRRAGKVKIVQTHTVNLYDYTNFAGEVTGAGSVENRLHYYGPGYNE